MISVLTVNAVQIMGQPKDYSIGTCCFSGKRPALMRKSKDWLARNQNNVPEWIDIRGLSVKFVVRSHFS